MLIVTFVTFALLNLLPGDVSLELLGSDATPSAIARVRSELRLDDPLVVRYMRWLGQLPQHRAAFGTFRTCRSGRWMPRSWGRFSITIGCPRALPI